MNFEVFALMSSFGDCFVCAKVKMIKFAVRSLATRRKVVFFHCLDQCNIFGLHTTHAFVSIIKSAGWTPYRDDEIYSFVCNYVCVYSKLICKTHTHARARARFTSMCAPQHSCDILVGKQVSEKDKTKQMDYKQQFKQY